MTLLFQLVTESSWHAARKQQRSSEQSLYPLLKQSEYPAFRCAWCIFSVYFLRMQEGQYPCEMSASVACGSPHSIPQRRHLYLSMFVPLQVTYPSTANTGTLSAARTTGRLDNQQPASQIYWILRAYCPDEVKRKSISLLNYGRTCLQ
jgi:hypothetical protein